MRKNLFLSFIFLLIQLSVFAQSEDGFFKKLEKYKIEPIIGLQMWGTYTFNQQVYNETTKDYEAVDNRFNAQLRRTRLGVKGQPYENIKFNITTAIDLVGRDLLSGTQGGVNNGASPSLRLWNAYIQWKISKNKDVLHMTVGYMSPQIGRESITSAWNSTSMEKAWSQNYLRRQLVGTGAGRAFGINLGGMFYEEDRSLNLSYDAGIFNPVFETLGGNSIGEKYAPLLVGRIVLHIGDPEFTKYSTSHRVNYFNQRKGISIALAGATQGTTETFVNNQAIGFDVLMNWGGFNFDGEWTWLSRKGAWLPDVSKQNFISSSNTGYLRLSYNIVLPKGRYLEPVFMMVQFNGALDAVGQEKAFINKSFAGKDHLFDIGLNYYLNKDFKLSLHYSLQKADAGVAGNGAIINNYFFQSGVGAIHRGDWLGIGFAAIF
jgi:phosphate-selective porin O/P